MNCKICNSSTSSTFHKTLLGKYDVEYFQCSECGFLQTEEPTWLDEAYEFAMSPLDVWLVSRPFDLSQITKSLILRYFDCTGRFLDYGGGPGVFTRRMRDLGLDFYRQDKYAKNLFAQYFSLEDLPPEDRKFELVTCFEVFEHLSDPIAEFDRMFALGESVLCSTSLQSTNIAVDLASWDYLGALHGQHISFYTEDSMLRIAEKYGKKYYSNGVDLHLFTPNEISNFQMVSLTTRLKNKAHKLVDTVFSVIEAPGPKSRELKSLINDDSKRVSEIVSQQQKKH